MIIRCVLDINHSIGLYRILESLKVVIARMDLNNPLDILVLDLACEL